MGLDVYLYKQADWQSLSEDDDRSGEQMIEIHSAKYPEHLFKVGYFRSSYNEAGFNCMMEQYGLPDLYDIFEAGDNYIFAPDWNIALKRIESAKKKLAQIMDTKGKYKVLRMDTMDIIRSEEEALAVFMDELKRGGSFSAYSNRKGTFYLDGLECVGFMQGMKYNSPCFYVVTKNTAENMSWYMQAFDIMEETVNYVLQQPNAQDFYFHWSG